jgi:hypothetical protein
MPDDEPDNGPSDAPATVPEATEEPPEALSAGDDGGNIVVPPSTGVGNYGDLPEDDQPQDKPELTTADFNAETAAANARNDDLAKYMSESQDHRVMPYVRPEEVNRPEGARVNLVHPDRRRYNDRSELADDVWLTTRGGQIQGSLTVRAAAEGVEADVVASLTDCRIDPRLTGQKLEVDMLRAFTRNAYARLANQVEVVTDSVSQLHLFADTFGVDALRFTDLDDATVIQAPSGDPQEVYDQVERVLGTNPGARLAGGELAVVAVSVDLYSDGVQERLNLAEIRSRPERGHPVFDELGGVVGISQSISDKLESIKQQWAAEHPEIIPDTDPDEGDNNG